MNDPLFQKFCSKETLILAWQRVRLKHTAGGIDRQTVENYQEHAEKQIDQLAALLESGKYIQQPYLEAKIPKNETENRTLGLLTINDKIVQTAASFVLTSVFEKSFLNVSYAYRSKKGAVKAIHRVQHLLSKEKLTWLAICDIDNFFDTIPHHLLYNKLLSFLKSPGMVEIIRMFVSMGRVNKSYSWKDSTKGIPQGGVISPMLANFYLYLLDKTMVDNQYGYVRYADDFIILCKSESVAARALNHAVSILTTHLQLKLNEGSQVIPVEKGFEFLGISFSGTTLSLSERKYKRLVTKMTDASQIGEGLITEKLQEVLMGITTFYARLVPQETLCRLDDELMSVLRHKAEIEHFTDSQIKKVIIELTKFDFFGTQHNFKKREYIESQLSIRRNKKVTLKPAKQPSAAFSSVKGVKQRKREYQKLESSGFDLVVNTPSTWIGKQEGRIVVKHKDVVVQEIPLLNLKTIIILGDGVVFSSNVIAACAEYHILINFLGHDGKPYAIIHQPEWFDSSNGLAQLKSYSNGKCFYLIRKIVRAKISNQVNLIKYYGKYYKTRIPAFEPGMVKACESMIKYADEMLSLEEEELDDFRMKAFAMEGLAASNYWETMAIIINTKTTFEKRERQGATDLVNCMLNYGYGILYGRITEALVRARLNPNLSYLHKPENNRPSLVFDFIEEFRQQAVDRPVFALIMKYPRLKCENGLLDIYTKKLLATKVIERLNGIEIFRGMEMRLFEIIHHQARNLREFLLDATPHYKSYIHKW